ncbi:MAG: threonine--tRNA ligase [Patescibacteria group bacterium]
MDSKNLEAMRHSCEHILHQAMTDLYPGLKRAMGPATEDGFYHDFDFDGKVTESDFPKIEKRMREIVNLDLPFVKREITIKEAKELFKNNPYKLDWVSQIEQRGESPTVYWTGEPEKEGSDVDLCKGPHVSSTGKVGVFKLLSIAGAYWHGNEKNKMLTRIYGTCFPTKVELEAYLKTVEEAKKRDHRKLGADLDLFVFSDLVGKGLPMLTPKGATIRRILERFIVDEEIKRGYQHVITPPLAKVDLYKTSGHYPYYKDTMYPPMNIDDDELILRPMTCPHHFMMYKSHPRSYRELPIRYAEISPQFRYEKSGELSGLMRVRMFMLADAHIICTKDQAKNEIVQVLSLIDYVNEKLGLKKGVDYRYRLSLGDRSDTKKYYKDDQAWDNAESVLKQVLDETQAPYYEASNEAAFYGPKIDIQIKNVNGKEDTAFTVQYDFVMPKRFELRYVNEESKEIEPVVIHRASLGCFERTMAFLIEHYGGAFPLWLAPVQVVVLPISSKHTEYGNRLVSELKKHDFRAELDHEQATIGKKIRQATLQKIPYMVIIGDAEIQASTLSVRTREGADLGKQSITEFIEYLKTTIEK